MWRDLGLIALFFTLSVVTQQNCAKAPRVDDPSSLALANGYTHTGDETSCLSCHSGSRPSDTSGFLGLNANAPFDYAAHGGSLDCFSCHGGMAPGFRSKSQWANGYFQHKITTASCTDCHSSQRPATTSGGSPHPATGDCASCHSQSLASVQGLPATSYATFTSALWKNATGVPTVLVSDPAKSLSVAVKVPVYGSNGILASYTSSQQTVMQTMNHQSAVTGVDMTQCSTCHSNQVTFIGGRFHSSLTSHGIAQPTTCTSCHDMSSLSKVTNAATAGVFTGIASNQTATTNPSLMNHVSVASTGECVSCHQQSNWSAAAWNLGQFHRTTAVPTTCTECHKPTRPSGLAGTVGFDHSILGTGECAGCHMAAITALGTKTINGATTATKLTKSDWAGGIQTPNGLVGTTTTPVAAVMLTITGGAVTAQTSSTQAFGLQMNHANYQTNCSTCHTTVGTFVGGKFHKNQTTQPTSCRTCHTAALNGFIVGVGVSLPIDHGHTTVTSKECTTCHATPTAAASSILFKDGSFHAKLTTQPTTCRECHSPKILTQPVWGTMNHATIGSSDCSTCHTFPGTGMLGSTTNPPNWKGSTAAMPATISLSPPSTQPGWGNLNIPHPKLVLSGIACASCHGTSTTAKIIGYDHQNPPTGAKCVYCHYSGQAVVGVSVTTQSSSHKNTGLNNDCSACHRPSYPTWSPSTGKWSGGSWN